MAVEPPPRPAGRPRGGQCRCACQSAGTRPAGPGTDWSSG
jgi:hypothetical protein